ncbi:undecaprenyl-diphosphatase [Allocatelliglobosispora scoriae]|uniref:Undecaprenyl-diphosphatase n=1 Tax=Allocatelliglobosispora scoriae TaxID=643052 RepID=A0A841BL79_9ACTN|nr:phosphatase PAP2 family protein [Allocatelliglobosispora scoriae]MBB5867502.1 undecaprenyl-diphosphatase [Allocatelliglobosispora scoriae]
MDTPPAPRLPRPAGMRRFAGSSMGGLAGTMLAGTGFAVLLLLVRARWQPLEDIDHGVAAALNRTVAAHAWMQQVLRFITSFGSTLVLSCVVAVVAAALVIRGRTRLAVYLLVTGVGAIIMGPALKLFVGRLRPIVVQTVELAPGNSFPSGHALASSVCYGALLLVFLPVLRERARRPAIAIGAALVMLIGFSRIALGVHFLSDVLGAWLLGTAWLIITAAAFETWRRHTGRPVTVPTSEGLEPEAARDIRPAPEREPTDAGTGWRAAAGLVVGWIITFGIVLGIGQLVSRGAGSNLLGDEAVPRWFADNRTAGLDTLSEFAALLGSTPVIVSVGLTAMVLTLAATRRWRPALFVLVVMVGEVTLFLATVTIIARRRPDVARLDGNLPTASFPSGHFAATTCLYATIAVMALIATRSCWRWFAVGAAVVLPLIVGWGRLYRGMHHPTDLLGSLLLAGCWLTVALLLVRPADAWADRGNG